MHECRPYWRYEPGARSALGEYSAARIKYRPVAAGRDNCGAPAPSNHPFIGKRRTSHICFLLALSCNECQQGAHGTKVRNLAAPSGMCLEPAPPTGNDPMKFRPLHDRVVIRRLEGEDKTKGGIIIPETVKEKPQEGEVVAVGPGARDESGKLVPVDLKAGDRVLFGKWSGTEVKIDGKELLIMKESDVMGVIEDVIAAKKAA